MEDPVGARDGLTASVDETTGGASSEDGDTTLEGETWLVKLLCCDSMTDSTADGVEPDVVKAKGVSLEEDKTDRYSEGDSKTDSAEGREALEVVTA